MSNPFEKWTQEQAAAFNRRALSDVQLREILKKAGWTDEEIAREVGIISQVGNESQPSGSGMTEARPTCPSCGTDGPCECPELVSRPKASRERDLHDEIEARCRAEGWAYVHSRMDKRSTNNVGTPDFILLRSDMTATPECLLIECKRPGQKQTVAQLKWAAWAKKNGWIVHLVHSVEEWEALL